MKQAWIDARYYNPIRGEVGSRCIQAWLPDDAAGLAIHQYIHFDGSVASFYQITHVATGDLVGHVSGYDTVDDACKAAQLLAMGIDWTRGDVLIEGHTHIGYVGVGYAVQAQA